VPHIAVVFGDLARIEQPAVLGSGREDMGAHALYLEGMDVAHDHEAAANKRFIVSERIVSR